MRHDNSRPSVGVTIDQDCLLISLSGFVRARTIDAVLGQITVKRGQLSLLPRTNLLIDLSKVVAVMPDGAASLVCLCSALMTKKMKHICSPVAIYLRCPPENVLSYLTRIGFFTLMSAKANLLGYGNFVRLEDGWHDRDRKERLEQAFHGGSDYGSSPMVWPMQIVGQKSSERSYRHFEDDCQQLVNSAADHFDKLFSSSHFNFDKADKHDFLHSIYELYMNIFEHSYSWGLTMIHARPDRGTFVCCYDIGIGFKEGLSGSANVQETIDTDHQAIKWALVEGHSRKVGGSGLGLKLVEKFVSERKGLMQIRSGDCLLRKRPGNAVWEASRVPWFPGAQIDLFIPVRIS